MMKILVRSPNWIGDQILAFPFFHYLRRAYPTSRIVVACVPWVDDLQYSHLIDERVILPKPVAPTWRARLDAALEGAALVRESGPYELAITLPNSFSSAWMLWRAGARRRRGYATDARSLFLNERVEWEPHEKGNRAEAYLRLLPERARPSRPVTEFWGVMPENDLDEKIPGEMDSFDPARAWPHVAPLEPPAEPYWVLAPGSMAESRRWPAQSFVALARRIRAETGLKGLVVGGAAEAPLGEMLCEDRSLGLSDWTAQGPVPSLWKLFRQARFTVSNDSGLAHVASLCGSSTQIVWGAGDPRKTLPIGPGKVATVFNPISCWPCEKNACLRTDGPKLECLKSITPEMPWDELKNVLKVSRDAG